MHSHAADWRHDHVVPAHDRNERRTWLVVGLTFAMTKRDRGRHAVRFDGAAVDGWHMSTHAGALGIAAAHRHARTMPAIRCLPGHSSAISRTTECDCARDDLASDTNPSAVCSSRWRPSWRGDGDRDRRFWCVNLASAWLGAGHHHDHGHGHGHDHAHDDHHDEHDHHQRS